MARSLKKMAQDRKYFAEHKEERAAYEYHYRCGGSNPILADRSQIKYYIYKRIGGKRRFLTIVDSLDGLKWRAENS